MIYKIVAWFTECPYFIFISSLCSIISMIAIINFLYFRKPKLQVDSTESQKIINKLLEYSSLNPEVFIPMNLSDFDDYPDLKGKKVDPFHSFYLDFDGYENSTYFALIKTNSDLRLYTCLHVLKSSFRLIATDKTNPDLKKLLSDAAKINDLPDEDFLNELLSIVEKL